MGKRTKKIISFVVLTAILLQTINAWAPPVSVLADTTASTSIFTDYLPDITEVANAESGFTHPGIGLTKELLENVRTKVRAGAEPWNTYFNEMLVSSAASSSVNSSNESSSDSSVPGTYAFNSQGVNSKFIADGLKAYTQAVLYYVTGNETYRSNAMHIIRIWSQMDPAQYVYFTDACIHTGIPLNRMVTAAEILKYTSCTTESLKWTDEDTTNFTNNLVTPVINTFESDCNHFMNQHNYTVLGAMAGYLFTDNTAGYNKVVEWFTVNSQADDQGFNGSVKQLFRWVTTEDTKGENVSEGTAVTGHVQHVEMGRDQAHGGGDLTNSVIMSRILLAQGTKVDPETGTASTGGDAVGPYEFLNNRILGAANYFWQYMLGYDTDWTKIAYSIASDGTVRDTYNYLSPSYRGRFNSANFWDLYSYYTYVKGENVAEIAPYYYEAFTKKLPSNFYYEGSLSINWNNPDGGGDFWLYLPAEAETDAAVFLPKKQASANLIEIEDRYTSFDSNNSTNTDEDGTSYVRFRATAEESKIALLNAQTNNKTVAFKVRTNGVAELNMTPGINDSMFLPDTGGEWRYVSYTMDSYHSLGDLLYLTVTGNDTTVDIDHLNVNAGTLLTPPAFIDGGADMERVAYVNAPISLSFTASDSGPSDVITYGSSDLPGGAELNSSTGVLTWQPAKAGSYTFFITVSDQTTVAVKRIKVTVTQDRASAIVAAIATYDLEEVYVEASLDNYNQIYEQTVQLADSTDDETFTGQLQTLCQAVTDLKLVSPLLACDGSLDYHDIVDSSTFGTSIINVMDNNPATGTSYTLAPNKYHILDFGPDYKVSATAFGFQSNIFADRLAGSAVFGSNDSVTWTRLTPGLTQFTQEFQTLAVEDAYKDSKYRYIKIQMLKNYPDIIHNTVQNLFEMTEFRIYGKRYEVGNKIAGVSIGSEQSVNSKISIGDTVTLKITAKDAIQNVKVTIQGKEAAVGTVDNINFIATAVMEDVDTGDVTFSMDYDKSDETPGDTVYTTTDDSFLFLVDSSVLLDVNMLATVTASDVQWPGTGLSAAEVGYLLFDGNISTAGDLNTANGSYYTVDFGAGAAVNLSEIGLMPRSVMYGRMNGLIIQGSNDKSTWTNLTSAVTGSQEGKWYDIRKDKLLDQTNAYRYLRLYNASAWSGNIAEAEFYGQYKATAGTLASKITDIDNPEEGTAKLTLPKLPDGYSISVKSSSDESVIATDGTITSPLNDTLVSLVLTVTKESDGTTADTPSIPVLVQGVESADKIDVAKLAAVTASAAQWVSTGAGLTASQIGYYVFDGDTTTAGDLKVGKDSYYIVDFGEGTSATINEIKILPRVSNYSRLNGMILQGSNDGTTWTDITGAVKNAAENTWIDITLDKLLNHDSYRYYKLINHNAWFGNVAEVEFYGNYDFDVSYFDTKTVPPFGYTQGSYYLYSIEKEAVLAAMNQPGADMLELVTRLIDAKALLVSTGTLTAEQITVTKDMVSAAALKVLLPSSL
ncbi:MAG: putative Ig domain-containing protein [Anaerocolumna sp.]